MELKKREARRALRKEIKALKAERDTLLSKAEQINLAIVSLQPLAGKPRRKGKK